jgi:predicted amidohydrolase YtcJ
MLPGFFDAHSHFYQTAVKLSTVNLDPPPAGKITSIDDILAVLEAELELHPRTENQWLFGWGYDNGMLLENRHPTRDDLDKVSLEVPIAIYHFSGHMLVLNSRGLEEMGFTADSVAPQGGVIRRLPDSREPNGIIEEQAIMPVLQLLLASVEGERLFELLDESQLEYKRQGFTTMLEMAVLPPLLEVFKAYAAAGKLDIDLAGAVMAVSQPAKQTAQLVSRQYQHRFRVAGAKVNLDGGSPGRTAYLREPYFTQDVGVSSDYRGYSSITQQQDLDDLVAKYYELETPVFIHALGDAAIDQAIHAVSAAQENFPRQDIRQQLIHLQVFQPDQMQALKKLDVSLTFQSAHNYYFADFHAANTLGPERTETLCPAGSAWREGFNVTLHHDSPVHPVNQLDLIWIATNRTSRSGKLYGPQERLSVYQALQASTINAAWQFFEEDRKGSLEVGKLADLVILDSNPLKMDKQDIRNIEVVETIKEGRTVWPVSL